MSILCVSDSGQTEIHFGLPFIPRKQNKQPNAVTVAKQSFTLLQRRIYDTAINQLGEMWQESDTDPYIDRDVLVSLPVKSISSNYSRVYQAAKGLQDAKIQYKDEHGRDISLVLFPSLVGSEKGLIQFRINQDFVSLIRGSLRKYTKYDYQCMMLLSSTHSQIVYVNASRWADTGWWQISNTRFREITGLETKYKRWEALEERVLLMAKNDINNRTELNVDYKILWHDKRCKDFDIKWTIEYKSNAKPNSKDSAEQTTKNSEDNDEIIDSKPGVSVPKELLPVVSLDEKSLNAEQEKCLNLISNRFKIIDTRLQNEIVKEKADLFMKLWKEKYFKKYQDAPKEMHKLSGLLLHDLGLTKKK